MTHAFLGDSRIATSGIDASKLGGKHVLVTGAGGLVGTHWVAAIRSLAEDGRGINITAAVRSKPAGAAERVYDHAAIRIVKAELSDPIARRSLPRADVIIHCAGYGQPSKFVEDPVGTIRVNCDATGDLLEKLNPGGRLIFVSSSEVYTGLREGVKCTEDQVGSTNPQHPRACYIEGKRCGEALCHAAFKNGGSAISVRLAQTYGPGAKPDDRRALFSFIEQGLKNGRIELVDDGEAIRSYLYVADAVRMMLKVVLCGKHPVYNISGCTRIRIRDLAARVGSQLGVEVVLPKAGAPIEGAAAWVACDMDRYVKEFGEELCVDLDEGISRTIAWQRHQ